VQTNHHPNGLFEMSTTLRQLNKVWIKWYGLAHATGDHNRSTFS